MSRQIQNQIDAIDLEAPRLKQYEPERYALAQARRRRLVEEQNELSRLETEILMRASQKFQPARTVQVYPTGEESFRCRNCQKLIHKGIYCHACKAEDQDWEC